MSYYKSLNPHTHTQCTGAGSRFLSTSTPDTIQPSNFNSHIVDLFYKYPSRSWFSTSTTFSTLIFSHLSLHSGVWIFSDQYFLFDFFHFHSTCSLTLPKLPVPQNSCQLYASTNHFNLIFYFNIKSGH